MERGTSEQVRVVYGEGRSYVESLERRSARLELRLS